jgi:hypothetical protein
MAALERFCLRWNDFEANLSKSFRELRDEADLFDLTLSVGDQQIQAHKLVLSACSPFFRSILKKNPHAHPLLYLKGVTYADLQAVLNFMYFGEVSVAQDSLNSFLAVAEELRVKGLTQNSGSANGRKSDSGDWTDDSKNRVGGVQRSSSNSSGVAAPVVSGSKRIDSVAGKTGGGGRPAPLDNEDSKLPAKKLKQGGLPPAAAASFSVQAYTGQKHQQDERSEEDDIQEVLPIKQEPGPNQDLDQPSQRGFDPKVILIFSPLYVEMKST